jgi:hypothetical protein
MSMGYPQGGCRHTEPYDNVKLPGFVVEIWRYRDDEGGTFFIACKARDELFACDEEFDWTQDGYPLKEKPSYALLVERAFSLWLMAHHAKMAVFELREMDGTKVGENNNG